MELRVEINSTVVEWLASMGYPVAGMPVELLRGMLLREARQWQIAPERLEMMILEGERPEVAGVRRPRMRLVRSTVAAGETAAAVSH